MMASSTFQSGQKFQVSQSMPQLSYNNLYQGTNSGSTSANDDDMDQNVIVIEPVCMLRNGPRAYSNASERSGIADSPVDLTLNDSPVDLSNSDRSRNQTPVHINSNKGLWDDTPYLEDLMMPVNNNVSDTGLKILNVKSLATPGEQNNNSSKISKVLPHQTMSQVQSNLLNIGGQVGPNFTGVAQIPKPVAMHVNQSFVSFYPQSTGRMIIFPNNTATNVASSTTSIPISNLIQHSTSQSSTSNTAITASAPVNNVKTVAASASPAKKRSPVARKSTTQGHIVRIPDTVINISSSEDEKDDKDCDSDTDSCNTAMIDVSSADSRDSLSNTHPAGIIGETSSTPSNSQSDVVVPTTLLQPSNQLYFLVPTPNQTPVPTPIQPLKPKSTVKDPPYRPSASVKKNSVSVKKDIKVVDKYPLDIGADCAPRDEKGNFHCSRCQYSSPMYHKYQQHLRCHGGRFICKACDKACLKLCDLTRHWLKHVRDDPHCDSCPYKNTNTDALQYHMKWHYITTPEQRERSFKTSEWWAARKKGLNIRKKKSKNSEDVSDISSEFDGARLEEVDVASLKKELMDAEGNPIPQTGEMSDLLMQYTKSMDILGDTSTEAQSSLGAANDGSDVKATRKRRPSYITQFYEGFGFSSTQTTVRMYCPECGEVYNRQSLLDRHRRRVHNKHDNVPGLATCPEVTTMSREPVDIPRPVFEQCEKCSKVFTTEKQAKVHKCSECTHCGKWVAYYYMEQHMRLHTGACPYKCSKCGAEFPMQAYLYSHQKSNCMRSTVKGKRRGNHWGHRKTKSRLQGISEMSDTSDYVDDMGTVAGVESESGSDAESVSAEIPSKKTKKKKVPTATLR